MTKSTGPQDQHMSAIQSGSSDSVGTRLESWKQIAAHLNRHVTTVRRWEKQEGLPVYRHAHSALDSVYAYATHLDAWLANRQPNKPFGLPVAGMASVVTARRGHVPPLALTGVTAWPIALLGRDREIETLRNVWRAASGGQQQFALITSEAGQGKTWLAWEFARSVVCQATVLTGVWDREALFPFAPFVSMLQWLVRACEASTLQRIFSEIEGSRELAQLVPEMAKHTPPVTQGFQATTDGRRFQLFEAFAQLVVAISRDCPMLLLFEDLHWADTGSLLFLRHLIRSTRDAALCIVVTYRGCKPSQLRKPPDPRNRMLSLSYVLVPMIVAPRKGSSAAVCARSPAATVR
jgi:AAA ATPase domain